MTNSVSEINSLITTKDPCLVVENISVYVGGYKMLGNCRLTDRVIQAHEMHTNNLDVIEQVMKEVENHDEEFAEDWGDDDFLMDLTKRTTP